MDLRDDEDTIPNRMVTPHQLWGVVFLVVSVIMALAVVIPLLIWIS